MIILISNDEGSRKTALGIVILLDMRDWAGTPTEESFKRGGAMASRKQNWSKKGGGTSILSSGWNGKRGLREVRIKKISLNARSESAGFRILQRLGTWRLEAPDLFPPSHMKPLQSAGGAALWGSSKGTKTDKEIGTWCQKTKKRGGGGKESLPTHEGEGGLEPEPSTIRHQADLASWILSRKQR